VRTSVRQRIARNVGGALVVGGSVLLLSPATPALAVPPLAAAPDTGVVGLQSLTATITLLDNDTGPDGAPATPTTVGVNTSPVSGPGHGSVRISPQGVAVYTPSACFAGTDSFVYQIVDPQDTSSTAQATVTVTVPAAAARPIARDDSARVSGGAAEGNVLANDCGGGALAVVVTSAPGKGTVVLDPETGRFAYRPRSGASGVDAFGYRLSNAANPALSDTAVVRIAIPAAPPVPTASPTPPAPTSPGASPAASPTEEPTVPPAGNFLPTPTPTPSPTLAATGMGGRSGFSAVAGAVLVLLGALMMLAARPRGARG
jgi:hypothetical protein